MGLNERTYIILLLLIAVLGTSAHFAFGFSNDDLSGHAWGSDDAFISYRYAYNYIDGHGLVFNQGEKVEGYTNLLYAMLAALFISINPDIVYVSCFVFNTLVYIATLLLFYGYLKHNGDENQARIGLFILCAAPVMWAWPASGLETSSVLLVQLALFVIADLCSRKYSSRLFIIFNCFLAIAIFLRADGFAFAFLSSTIFLLKKKYRCFTWALGIIVVLSLVYLGVRFAYYGDILPNTFYAKVSGSLPQRLEYAAYQFYNLSRRNAFLVYLIPILLGPFQILNKLLLKTKFMLEDIPLIPYFSLMTLAYWLYIGGDVFYERFLLILIPLSIIYIISIIPARWQLAVLLYFLIIQVTPLAFDQRFDYQIEKYDRGVELGKFLGDKHPQDTLAVDTAGKIPYYSGLYTIDMLGLTNKYIGKQSASFFRVGHNKFNPEYIFNQRPDLIAAEGSKGLDLAWGIIRERYISEGYTMKYIVNSSADSKPENIIDVTGYGIEEIKALYEEGYAYFVISRNP